MKTKKKKKDEEHFDKSNCGTDKIKKLWIDRKRSNKEKERNVLKTKWKSRAHHKQHMQNQYYNAIKINKKKQNANYLVVYFGAFFCQIYIFSFILLFFFYYYFWLNYFVYYLMLCFWNRVWYRRTDTLRIK